MGLLDSISSSNNLIGAVSSGVNTLSDLSGSFNLADTLLNGTGLAAGAEAVGDIVGAVSSFGGDAAANDWRVRLSLANWTSIKGSPVLKPLKDAGGLIFPYTPTISLKSSANYSKIDTVHSNYTFQAFKNSDPGSIEITAPMNVEDATQGLYWIAAVHYLRSLTKMFTGSDPKAGNPPPVVFLNGYGNYVFKNVPVVVTNFTCTLPNDCDYIGVNVVGSAAGGIEGVADAVGGLAGSLGSAIPGLSDITDTVSSISGAIGNIAGVAGSLGLGGTTSGGVSHVPVKSSFSVTLTPIYSRNSAKNFSLDRFVQGGYLNNPFGYI